MSKSPSYVSKNATYIGPDFLPTSKGSKNIPKTKQYYLLGDVKYSKDGKASKIKTVYEKGALVKSIRTAKSKGLDGARSMAGTKFRYDSLIPIGVSPNRLRKLFAKLGTMGSAFKGLTVEKVMARRGFINTGSPLYKMSPGEKEKFPSHWGTHKWHSNNYDKLWGMIADGKIKTVQQLSDIDTAFKIMEYGGKNPKKLIHKVLNGTVQAEQVRRLYSLRDWIYGKESGSRKEKINRFLENKVLKGELTEEVWKKFNTGPDNQTKVVAFIKGVFHKK
jgi:hypothetical protein